MQARVNSPVRPVWTRLSTGGVFVLIAVALLASAVFGQVRPAPTMTPNQPVVGINEPAPTRGASEPYVAEVTGNDVFVRSGPGTNFYQCGKLYAGDRVQVISSNLGWSCIVPPPGCFSWVSMQYVSINLENPTMGIITGDNVGVYAGSDFVLPMHSTSKQVVLNRGQNVKLLGEEKDDYYKIAPPQGASLWVSSQFVEQVDRPVAGRPPEVNVGAMVAAPTEKPEVVDSNAPKTDLDLYYMLAEQVKAQRAKPVAEQDYAEVKTKLAELAAKQEAGRAARYAEYTIKQVERFELACRAVKELELQTKSRMQITDKIDDARTAKLAQIDDLGKYAVIGTLETSSIYTGSGASKRFRLLDETGKTICYVTPTGAAANADYDKLMGKKVGLVGTIQPHEASSRAFVEFTEAVPLD